MYYMYKCQFGQLLVKVRVDLKLLWKYYIYKCQFGQYWSKFKILNINIFNLIKFVCFSTCKETRWFIKNRMHFVVVFCLAKVSI